MGYNLCLSVLPKVKHHILLISSYWGKHMTFSNFSIFFPYFCIKYLVKDLKEKCGLYMGLSSFGLSHQNTIFVDFLNILLCWHVNVFKNVLNWFLALSLCHFAQNTLKGNVFYQVPNHYFFKMEKFVFWKCL